MSNSIAIRKAVVLTLIAALLAWAGAAYVFSLTQSARAASAGDLIKMDGNPAVYYLGSDDKRYVFPNEKTYKTWYQDFSGVVTVSQSELESYAIGGNVTYRAGTRLGKITTDPKVYAIEPGGILRWVTSESIASDLYGANWNQRIDDIPDPFFVNYTVGSDISSSDYPTGSLVKESGSSDIYYIDGTEKRKVADSAAFDANGWNWDDVIETSLDLSGLSAGTEIAAAEEDLTTTAGPGVTPPTASTGTLSVALAADTPASGTVVGSAAQVRFTTVNFTASGGDVTIDSLMIERTGLSTDTNFSELILIDESDGSQLGNEKSLGSEHTAVFNDDILVANGTTKKISIAANMAATTSMQSGEVAVLTLKEVTLAGSATLSGTLPIDGNGMTMNSTVSIGTVTQQPGGLNPSASTQKVGTTDYILTSSKLTVATENVNIERLRYYNNGTAADEDVANFDLLVDGEIIATVAEMKNKEVVFDLSASPIKIKKGNNKQFSLRADIISGSARTISMDFDKKIDIKAKGLTFGFYITPTYTTNGTTTVTSSPYMNAPDTTVAQGSLTASKGVLSSLNVAEGAAQQELGAFKFNAQGEPVNVTRLALGVVVSTSGSATTSDVTNLTIYDPDGAVAAGPFDPSDVSGQNYGRGTTTDTIVFPVGINTYIVKGDLSTDFSANDTIKLSVIMPSGAITAKGDVTNKTITAAPTSDVSGDTMTVKVGSLRVSTSATPAAQSVIIGETNFTFANYVLDAADSGEDVKVTQFAVKHVTDAANKQDNIANLQLYDGTTAIDPIVQPSEVAGTTATSTFTFTSPILIKKGESKTLTLKGDLNAGTGGTDTHAFGCVGTACVTSSGAETGNSITATVTNSDGQTMSAVSTGTLTVADDASNPTAGLLVAGSSKVTLGELRLTATNEDIDLTSILFDDANPNSASLTNGVSKLYLYDGATQITSLTPTDTNAATFTITAGDFRIPAGSVGKKLTVKADLSLIQTGSPGASGGGVTLSVAQDAYAAKGVASGSSIAAGSKSGIFSGKQFNFFKSLPTITVVNISSTTLNNASDVELFKFKITADSNGDVGFYKATFDIATSVATVTTFKMTEFNADGSTGEQDVTANASRSVDETITASTGSPSQGGTHRVNVLMDTDTSGTNSGVTAGGEYRTIAAGQTKLYKFTGTIASAVSGSSVSTKLVGDPEFAGTYPDAANDVDSDDDDSFIWSDLNYGNNSTTATQTEEWYNGFRLFSTTTAQTMSK